MKNKKILITGGAGFIGSHLTETLLANHCHVTIIDDLSTGRWENVEHLKNHPNLRVIIASACDADLIKKEVPEHELVYHLASAVGVKLIIQQPVKTVETIFHATDVLLNACAKYRCPIVITSTSEVYGKSAEVPFQEDQDVVMGPTSKRRWAYACAKALDEFLALAHFYETRLPVFLLRLFNTVGPRQSPQYGMVLPTFVNQAISGVPITVYGDGEQSRCFCSVFDIVRGLVKLPQTEEAIGKVINLGSQEEITIGELAKRVVALAESNSPIEYIEYDEAYAPGFDDMRRRVPDITRANQLLGWQPEQDLNAIILRVISEARSSIQQSGI